MFPKEIVEIIQKYQNPNSIEIIDNCIESIITELSQINNNITEQLYFLMDKRKIDVAEEKLLKDSQTLRNFIIKMSVINEENLLQESTPNKDKIHNNEQLDEPQNNIIEASLSNNVIVNVVKNMLCPNCNVNIKSHMIHYMCNGVESGIWWYKCPKCNKLYCIESEIKDFDFSKTNIILNWLLDDFDNFKEIHTTDTIVLSTLRYCNYKEHKVKDVIANIPIYNETGEIDFITMNISYCCECNKYIMLKYDYKLISGIIACKVIDYTTINDDTTKDNIEESQHESILYKYGYNVKSKNAIPDKQRHIILASVVESNILTREQICSHLDMLIERGSKIEKWKNATQKWKQDREYVKKYNVSHLPQILLNRVILKYQTNQTEVNTNEKP